jgi:hypothetical protein
MFSSLPLAEEGHFHVGAFAYDPGADLEALLQRLTGEDPFYSSWFKNAKRLEGGESCVVNVWQAMEKPYKDHVILVGDSCWSQEFSNGAALCAGHKLGHALTKAFHDGRFNEEGLSLYLDWYATQCFEPYGQVELGGGGSLSDYLTAEEMDYLAALPGKPAPHTMDFFELFATIMETYSGLVPQITEERPEIMKKLHKMDEDGEAAMAKTRKAGFPNK